MTCIAGMIDKQGVGHIASDSIGSNGHTKDVYRNKKIFRKGALLIGYTSSYRMGQLLEHNLTLPARKVDQSLDEYIYVDLVAAVRSVLKSEGYLKIDSNTESIGTFMIITEGRLFMMQNDLAILEAADGFDSCGSGENFAVATISTLIKHTKLTPEAVLREAIETATRYVATVGGEIQYLSSEPRD